MITNPPQAASAENYSPPNSVAERRRDALLHREYPEIRTVEGLTLPVDDFGVVHPRRRVDLQRVPPDHEIGMAEDWLTSCASMIKTPASCSYGIKHRVEFSTGEYIANGALILAAYRLGYRLSWNREHGPNVLVAVSQRSLNQPCDCAGNEVAS